MDRRRFLAATGMAAVATTAGCLGGDDATDDPESVVEAYYDIVDDVDSEEDVSDAIDDIEDISHSVSPLPDLLEGSSEEENEIGNNTIDSVETDILEENVDTGELREEGYDFFFEEEEIETIADSENAIVEATVQGTVEDANEEQSSEWLVAEEDGDWLLVL